MTLEAAVRQLPVLMVYGMVIMALIISASTALKRMITLFRAQAWLLTLVVLLTGLTPGHLRPAVALLGLLPATLAVMVPPLLGRASLTAPGTARVPAAGRDVAEGSDVFPGRSRSRTAALLALMRAPADADLIWLQNGRSVLRGGQSASIDMMLIATAVLFAGLLGERAGGGAHAEAIVPNVSVSVSLVLQGLFTMINKRDIIAQIIGLLVMDQGLFIAAVRVAPPAVAPLFVVSLFFYILITLTILLWILPELHRASMSLRISDLDSLRG